MTGLIELKISDLNQLFHSMDPSPFRERDLDRNAEEFIVSWAQEHHRKHVLKLVIHLGNPPGDGVDPQAVVTEAIRRYFAYRAEMTALDRRRLMREGRVALFVGLLFLGTCQLAANLLLTASDAHWQTVAREGLSIVGWVAMWKPLDLHLYRWWPLLARQRLFHRLSVMPVEVRELAA